MTGVLLPRPNTRAHSFTFPNERVVVVAITYGLAEYDRFTGIIDVNINLPMDGVQPGNIYEFFRSAGENDWELCAAFPEGVKGMTRALPPVHGGKRVCEDAAQEIEFLFKRVE